MKKQDIVDLIDAHVRNNDAAFKNIAYKIAKELHDNGDIDLSNYIIGQITPSLQMTGQSTQEEIRHSSFFKEIEASKARFVLPDSLSSDLKGIVNALSKRIGINKFLFVGAPGTGKTEAVKQLGRVLHRNVYMANFETVIDSRMGMTAKNINMLFEEINSFAMPQKAIFLFDEIDSIALDRINRNDIREMGRATSTLLHCLDYLNSNAILIATTNLQKMLDPALKRRFDAIINFDRYTSKDLVDIAQSYIDSLPEDTVYISKDSRLLNKIICYTNDDLTPGRILSMLRTSIAFGDGVGKDYLKRFYYQCKTSDLNKEDEIISLKNNGFTVREMEVLTGISKSEIDRIIQRRRAQ